MKVVTSGKRKTAIARAILTEGKGKITINKKDYQILSLFDKLRIAEPIRIAQQILGDLKFDVEVIVKGGGEKGQIDAARVALSRALVEGSKSKQLQEAYIAYDRNLLVADVRRKETYKPGDSRARANRQSSKR